MPEIEYIIQRILVIDTTAVVSDSETRAVKFNFYIWLIGLFWNRVRSPTENVIRDCVHLKLSTASQAVYTVVNKIEDTIQQRNVAVEHLNEEPFLWICISFWHISGFLSQTSIRKHGCA